MFAFLRGEVSQKGLHHVELDVQGVGYEVHVPDGVHRKLRKGDTAKLLTVCHIREDVFQIFGFLHEEERALFRSLLSISGVGPRMALAILSQLSVAEFGSAIMDSNVSAFTKVSGVGKKTGQRLILEMKAKLGQDAELHAILGEPESGAPADGPEQDDVVAALCSLGCTLGEAKKAAAAARRNLGEGASDEDLVKAALRTLSKV